MSANGSAQVAEAGVPEARIAVARIDRFRVHPEDLGEFLDDHVEYELAEFFFVFGPGQQRPPVQHDPWSRHRPGRIGGVRAQHPGKRYAAAVFEVVRVRNFLDREFHVGKFRFPARFEPGHGLQHQVVELLCP